MCPFCSQVEVSGGAKSTTGVLEEKCIFCNKKGRIKIGCGLSAHFEHLITVVTESFQRTVKRYAEISNDQDFKRNYGSVDLIAREAKYHKFCHRRFYNKTLKLKQGQYYRKRGNAFSKLVKYIKIEVLKNGKSETLTNLTKKYLELLSNEGIENPSGKAQFLCEKLKRQFGSNIKVTKQKEKDNYYCQQRLFKTGHHQSCCPDSQKQDQKVSGKPVEATYHRERVVMLICLGLEKGVLKSLTLSWSL